jgi:hypothetical protein
VTTRNYEIRVTGSIGPAAREAFSGMGVDVEPLSTVLFGPLDKDGLQRTLDRVRALGLELLGVRQVPAAPGKSLSRTDRGDSASPTPTPGPATPLAAWPYRMMRKCWTSIPEHRASRGCMTTCSVAAFSAH